MKVKTNNDDENSEEFRMSSIRALSAIQIE